MFRVIGGAVVYGFALYGVVKLLEQPVMASVQFRNAGSDKEIGGVSLTGEAVGEDSEPSASTGSESTRGPLPVINVL